ncbi:hypothetical protein ACJMK2_031211 [Sinanodonta woodiana]|uniref:Mitochondria-eating protein C-terminal domain-containing protein n=1 Tax=Sinanodonta woodiana TaxID=1069815 RepID=A0ABD3X047_SINWO
MALAQQTASKKTIDPKSSQIDHIANILKDLKKDKTYKENAALAISQWNSTLAEMETLRSKDQRNPSEKKAVMEQEKSMSKSSEQKAKREQEKDMRIVSLEQQVKELTHRLSTIAGDRLSDANSDITDLSDPYRPTKLAEMFREVYNEEWTDAFQYYDSVLKNEDEVLDALAFYPKDIYEFCGELFKQQSELLEGHMQHMFKVMTEPTFKVDTMNNVCAKPPISNREVSKEAKEEGKILIKRLQKSLAKSSTSDLFEIYLNVRSFKNKPEWKHDVENSKALQKFISKLLELIWLMMSQDPPIVIKWLKPDTQIDKARFVFYTKSGDIVRKTVWPAVHLHETGPLMARGVVQAK